MAEVIGYPIENFIYELPEETIRRIIVHELLQIVAEKKVSPQSGNFEAFLKAQFGETLVRYVFRPYTIQTLEHRSRVKCRLNGSMENCRCPMWPEYHPE
jgi:hypothetical protein